MKMNGIYDLKVYNSAELESVQAELGEKYDECDIRPVEHIRKGNALSDAYINNIATALVDKDFAWSTQSASTPAFPETYINTMGCSDNLNAYAWNYEYSGVYSTCIMLRNADDTTGNKFICRSPANPAHVANASTGTITGYAGGVDTTWVQVTIKTVNSWANAGNGTLAGSVISDTTGLSVAVTYQQTTKVVWTLTISG